MSQLKKWGGGVAGEQGDPPRATGVIPSKGIGNTFPTFLKAGNIFHIDGLDVQQTLGPPRAEKSSSYATGAPLFLQSQKPVGDERNVMERS